jgi:CubicO group peptidase (beta-lactamase class C family)
MNLRRTSCHPLRTLFVSFTSVVLVGCGTVWAMEQASGSRIAPDALENAIEYSQHTGGQSLLVRQWGKTVHESYAEGSSLDTARKVFSITKSLAAMACFIAASEGWLDIDRPASDLLTEWKSDPVKRRITVRQLLNQTAGIASGFPSLYAPKLRDKSAQALRLPIVFPPGEQFDYGPAYFEALETLLSRLLEPRGWTVRRFIESRVLSPARAQAASEWRTDGEGNVYLSTGAQLTARGVAVVAGLILSEGRVAARRVFPSRFISEAAAGSSANRMYGLTLWNNQNTSRPAAQIVSIEGTLGREFSPAFWQEACLSLKAPDDLLAMAGSGGTRAYIVPSQGLVIVRFGSGSQFSDAAFLDLLFTRKENR